MNFFLEHRRLLWSVLLALAYALLLNCPGAPEPRGFKRNIPRAGILIGTPLAWRTLDRWAENRTSEFVYLDGHGVSAADFDQDGADEILASKPTSRIGKMSWRIYDVEGRRQIESIPSVYGTSAPIPWDYQGDGTIELAVEFGSSMEIIDQTGTRIGRLSGIWPDGVPLIGDISGDGKDELFLLDLDSFTYRAYDATGDVIWSRRAVWPNLRTIIIRNFILGDIDGDGRDEVIMEPDKDMNLIAGGIGQALQLQSFVSWQTEKKRRACAGSYSCEDLDADGVEEIICATIGFLNPAIDEFTNFRWPIADGTAMYLPLREYQGMPGVVWHDPQLSDAPLIAVAVAHDVSKPSLAARTAIYMFDLQGQLVYYEEFGRIVYGITTAKAKGQEYLIVILSDRLLISP